MFLFNKVEGEVNLVNPLGTKGKLLTEFLFLIREYYKTKKSSLNPAKFKQTLCTYLTTFEGYSQHDSQEFLSQLMDQLHEDINRIRSKPQTTNVEGKKNDDIDSIARQCWIVFLRRNYSFFINLFFGQFKSIVECPKCGNNSMTFDPFQLLTLVTPDQSKISYQIFFIPWNNSSKNVKVSLKVKSIHKFNDFQVG